MSAENEFARPESAGAGQPSAQQEGAPGEFLAAHGGPFYELQKRLQLLHDRALRTGSRAMIFTAAAWGVPFLLGLPAGLLLDEPRASYLTDIGPWSKYVIAIGAFILAEQQVERGLRVKLGQFFQVPIIAPSAIPAAAEATALALRRRDSRAAELVCLAVAALAALLAYLGFHSVDTPSWAVRVLPEGNRITAAGWWTIFVSLPLFTFLLLRGLWRHLVWAWLLRRIAALELRLVATHPDGKAGLSFVAQYPNAYILFIFGISCALAAGLAKHLVREGLTLATFSTIMGGWLIIVLALFAYPLSAFSKPLATLKEKSLLMLGGQATHYHRSAERKVIGHNVVADSAEETEPQDVPDPSKQFEAARKLSMTLVSRAAALPVTAAALLPFAIVGATKLPVKDVFSVLKKLLLI